jgi:hypothetical protein
VAADVATGGGDGGCAGEPVEAHDSSSASRRSRSNRRHAESGPRPGASSDAHASSQCRWSQPKGGSRPRRWTSARPRSLSSRGLRRRPVPQPDGRATRALRRRQCGADTTRQSLPDLLSPYSIGRSAMTESGRGSFKRTSSEPSRAGARGPSIRASATVWRSSASSHQTRHEGCRQWVG